MRDKYKAMLDELCKHYETSQRALVESMIQERHDVRFPPGSTTLVFVVTSYSTLRGATTSDTDIIGVASTFPLAKRLAERDCAKHFPDTIGEWEDDGEWCGEADFLNPNENVYWAPPSMLIGDTYRYNITPCYVEEKE
jgi:hypothetical protein